MTVNGSQIIDEKGRELMLRGVNLGGSSKIPAGDNFAAGINTAGITKESISFVGRPFPLEEAEDHFERLKNWGFTFIRFIVTWEALEHLGPGIYDEAYIAYLRKILLIAEKKGISIFMDPHQDVWSRRTGGDGAPEWTLEKLGMDLNKLEDSGAAIITPKHGENQMIWPVNYSLYAAATMFSVFFAGNTYAPQLKIDGENAQDYLSEHYIAAFRHCYRRLKNCNAIIGWGTMNEPHPGFIGNSDLRLLQNAALAKGPVPSPWEAMIAASGRPVKAPVYTPWIKGWKVIGSKTINPGGVSLFREGYSCPWKQAGIWTDEGENPRLLKPDHFFSYKGRPCRFTDDFLKPFMLRYIEKINEIDRPSLFFIEGVPHDENPAWKKDEGQNMVNAFHHYDGTTLFTKSFRSWLALDQKTGKILLGKKKAAALYSAKLAEAKTWAREHMDNMPCLLGEFGLPFDLNNKKAYTNGDYSVHETALSLYYDAVDENLLSSTIWNYCADNTHEEGDHWNGEDLSIVANGEGRAIKGWLRPYPMATAGTPLKFLWDRKKAALYFRFRADPKVEVPTELFLPSLWFGEKPSISSNTIAKDNGSEQKPLRLEYLRNEQRLFIYNDGYKGEVEIRVI